MVGRRYSSVLCPAWQAERTITTLARGETPARTCAIKDLRRLKRLTRLPSRNICTRIGDELLSEMVVSPEVCCLPRCSSDRRCSPLKSAARFSARHYKVKNRPRFFGRQPLRRVVPLNHFIMNRRRIASRHNKNYVPHQRDRRSGLFMCDIAYCRTPRCPFGDGFAAPAPNVGICMARRRGPT